MRILIAAAALVVLFTMGGCLIAEGPGGHYHGDGCGHYFWHDAWWDDPHPMECRRCAGPVHVHRDGCGHYFWHDGWWDAPHASDCHRCARPMHLHGDGCGHHFWHDGWHDHPHPPGC